MEKLRALSPEIYISIQKKSLIKDRVKRDLVAVVASPGEAAGVSGVEAVQCCQCLYNSIGLGVPCCGD